MSSQDRGNVAEEAGKLGAMVPELYFDIIARFVPAATVLLAYFPPWTARLDLSTLNVLAVILVTYFIGITVDISTSVVEPVFGLNPVGQILQQIGPLPASEQDRVKKLLAEAVLFRSCIVLCVPLFFYHAPLLVFTGKYYDVYVIGLMVVFFLCHVNRRVELYAWPARLPTGGTG